MTYIDCVGPFNPRRAGGSLRRPFLSGFSWTAIKRRRAEPPFLAYFLHILSVSFLKVSAQIHLSSGHQATSSDLPPKSYPTSKTICDCAVTIVLNGSTWNFQELIRASVPTKRVSRNFDFSNLRSGQFSDQTIIRQREYLQMLLIPIVRGKSS